MFKQAINYANILFSIILLSACSGSGATSGGGGAPNGTTYTATGTYTFDPNTKVLNVSVTSSNIPSCNGPQTNNVILYTVATVNATTLTLTSANNNTLTLTRASGGTDITGTWTLSDNSTGNSMTLTINNGTFTMDVNLVKIENCNSGGGGSGAPVLLTINGNGTGSGTVTTNTQPAMNCIITNGISVSGCQISVPSGTAATLTFTPNPGSNSGGWQLIQGSAGCSPIAGNTNSCIVTLSSNTTILGIFNLTGGGVPSAPTGLGATPGNSQVVLNWNSVSGANSYNVYRGTSSGSLASKTKIPTGLMVPGYTDQLVTNGTTYFYQVSAVNSSGESAGSNEVSAMPTGSATSAVGSLLIATSAPNGIQLSSFPFTSNGNLRSATPGNSLVIPSTPPSNGCGGALQDSAYDKGYHLLFFPAYSGTTTMICAYSADPIGGTLTPVSFSVSSSGTSGYFLDTFNHVAGIFPSNLYSYDSSGNKIGPAIGFNLNNVPAPYNTVSSLLDGDLQNKLIWYGTQSQNSDVYNIYGSCNFTFSSSTGYTATTCTTPLSSPLSVNRGGMGQDSTNGLTFMVSPQNFSNNNCSTLVNAFIYSYSTATGVLSSGNPVASETLGPCVQIAFNSNRNGIASSVDFTNAIFFGTSVSSGVYTIYPFPYIPTTPPMFPAQNPPAKTISTSTVSGTIIDPDDQLLFTLTGASGMVTGVAVYPYTNSGLGNLVPSAVSMSSNNSVLPCTSNLCAHPNFAILK